MTVQGERFSYLNWCALFVGAILLVIAAFAAQLSRPNNADSNVDSGA
jgi:ABC-type Fe3+-siderophore transport system permease subunit